MNAEARSYNTIRFEVHLRSQKDYIAAASRPPFPGCEWNEKESRWEWPAALVSTITYMLHRLGHPVLIRPAASSEGDLDILEVVDVEEDE